MKSLKKQRRIQLIAVAVVALIGSTALIGYGMRDGINFFRAPTQVVAEPPAPTEVFPHRWLGRRGHAEAWTGEKISFSVTDGGASVPVTIRVCCLICLAKMKAWLELDR